MRAALGMDQLEESIRIALEKFRAICDKLSADPVDADVAYVEGRLAAFRAAAQQLEFKGTEFKGRATGDKWMSWFDWVAAVSATE